MELVCFNESTYCNSQRPTGDFSTTSQQATNMQTNRRRKVRKDGKIENKKKHAFRHMNLEEEKQVLRASHPQVRSPTYPHHRNG